jgi:hypothetical protein
MSSIKTGIEFFNSSEIKKRKNLKKKEKEIKRYEMTQKMSFLDNISTTDNTKFNKDVLDIIKMMLINPSSTSKTSNILDKNDYQNFNRKKLIEIIKSKLINIDELLKKYHITQNELILEIETGTILPSNDINKPIFQKILSNYYKLRMFFDIEKITNFEEAKNSSQFKIQESDKEFFNNVTKKGSYHLFGEYNSYKFGNYFSRQIVSPTLIADNNSRRFLQIFGVDLNGKDNRGERWTHHTTMLVLLIFRHVNFQKIIEESIFNNYGRELIYNVINEERSSIRFSFFDICQIENLSLFGQKMINKTYFKIMKKNGINKYSIPQPLSQTTSNSD